MNSFTKIAIVLSVCISSVAMAQMPHDAIYMPKNSHCIAVSASQSQWKEYWENQLKRENFNIGTLTTQSIMPMVAIGVTDKLNVIVGIPYVSTKASSGNLMGQSGIQDLSGWLKYKAIEKGGLSIHPAIGASIPIGNYVPDFLPMSIGTQTKTATARLIGIYQTKFGLYLQAHGSYTYRSLMKVDRDAYQANNKVYNTNKVSIPNTIDARAAIGYNKKGIQLEAFIEDFKCDGGDNIRRNDMPFPTNNMKGTFYGAYAKFQPKNIGFNARYAQCYQGRNIGETTTYSVGLLYQIKSNNSNNKK